MKYLLILLLLPIHLYAKACFVLAADNYDEDFDMLKKCKDGQQLHLSIGQSSKDFQKAYLIGKRASFCDVKYNAYIESVSSISTLTCIFKRQLD